MTIEKTDKPITDIPQLRAVLDTSNDEGFLRFMHGYALGYAADLFIGQMTDLQRIDFLVAIAKTYPEEWKKAIVTL